MGDRSLVYGSTKTYTHSVGLSCCFRQWRADSHCKYLHGYALKVQLTFEALDLDKRNWVVDFGSLKPFKQILEDTFDHKLLVAQDDPQRAHLEHLNNLGVADVLVLESLGMEQFASAIFETCEQWLIDAGYGKRVSLAKVEVWEHEGNSAYVRRA